MRKLYWVVALGLALALVPAGGAAENEAQKINQVYFVDVNLAQAAQFEAATKGHMGWHRESRDPWAWETWQVVNGRRLGQYVVLTGPHSWADFDTRTAIEGKDLADWQSRVAPYVKGVASIFEVVNGKISRLPEGMERPKMAEVTVFRLREAGFRAFYHAVEKLHQAIVKKDASYHYEWRTWVNGGDGPTMVLLIPRNSWAEFAPEGAFWDMVEEVYGDFETGVLRRMINKSVVSAESLVVAYRPDLSYSPAK